MSQRKLTRRQAWRAKKIQDERLARSRNKENQVKSELAGGELGAEQSGRVITRYGAQVDIEDAHRQVHRCLMRQNLPSVVCGDRVVWQPGQNESGIVVAVEDRDSVLERPDADNQLKAVAANINQILVTAAPVPALDIDLINRYLVAAQLTRIPPALVINKIDLLDEGQLATLKDHLCVYEDIGYPVIYVTTKRENGLDDLLENLRDKTSILVGQSGVGKSSLIQALLPAEELRIGEISEASGLGQHTTTTTRLYHFTAGGELIDSPGVRAFRLGHVQFDDVVNGFVEFHPYLGQCRFNDCRHAVEPDCALLAAVESGEISLDRFESFQRIIEGIEKPHEKSSGH